MTHRTRRCTWPLLLLLAATSATFSQTPSPTRPLAFEVVSIKHHDPADRSGSVRNTPDGIQALNMPLSLFVHGINAPAWLTTERYDMQFKVAAADLSAYQNATPAETARMVHAALEDRLQLKDHTEARITPIFHLVAARSGTKLKPSTAADAATAGLVLHVGTAPGERYFIGHAATLSELASQLSYMADIGRLVVDQTGLSGTYDFRLNWMLSTQGDGSGPSIVTALQEQLGLRLEPTKAPVDVVVIDHIERPSAN